MKWRNKSFFLKIFLASLLSVQLSIWIVKAPSYTNGVSISSGIEFRPQHAEREVIHDCDDSTGFWNLTVHDYTFSTDTVNFTQGVASVKTVVNCGVGATVGLASTSGLGIDVSDKDYVDWWIRVNATISNYHFVLRDSLGATLHWRFIPSAQYNNFTYFELPLANPSFEDGGFNRTDIDYIAFTCDGVGFISIWMDFISASVWQHSYVTQTTDSYQNVTLSDGVLGLAKDSNAFNIECQTEDRVTTQIIEWFDPYKTRLRPYSLVSSAFTFEVNTRSFGEPQGISGETSYSYDEATTTLTFACANFSLVTITFSDMGTRQVLWYLDRIPMFLGIGGLFMVFLAPVMFVFFGKQDEWQSACVWGLMCAVIGIGLVVGWLWT